jgi:uncharacterized protein GlcG (DUF336 family)
MLWAFSLLLLDGCSPPAGDVRQDPRGQAGNLPTDGCIEAGTCVPSLASTIADMPRNIPRSQGPGLAESIAAAKAAFDACKEHGVAVSVLVADSAGEPVVMLSGDGAGYRSQLIARTKVAIVVRYRMQSGDVETAARQDPALAEQAAADPNIGVLRGGGFPLWRDGDLVGAVAVSGAIGRPGVDDKCALVAVEMLQSG